MPPLDRVAFKDRTVTINFIEAVTGRKHTLFQKSIIDKTHLKLGVIIFAFSNYEQSFSRQLLPSPDPLR